MLSLLALLACAPKAPPADVSDASEAVSPEEAAETVSLRFGWRDGDRAVMRTTSVTTREQGGVVHETAFEQASVGEVDRTDSGDLVLTTINQGFTQVQRVDGVEKPLDPVVTRFVEQAVAIPFRARVSADGQFDGLADPEAAVAEYERAITSFVDGILAGIPDPAAQERVRSMFTSLSALFGPQALVARIASDWQASTGFWLGADLVLGEEYELQGETAFPMGGQTLPVVHRFGAESLVPCHDGPDAPTCVVLNLTTRTDAEALGAAVTAQVGQLLPEFELDLEVEDTAEYRIVTEPDTLRPWEIRTTQVTRSAAVGPDGVLHPVTQRVQNELTYTWE